MLYNHVFQDWVGFYFTQDQALIFNASPLCDPKLGILVLSLTCAGVHAKKLQVCLTVCDPKGCSPQGSSVHGVFQARILEWVAMPSSGGIFLTQGLNLGLQRCRWVPYHWATGEALPGGASGKESACQCRRSKRCGLQETPANAGNARDARGLENSMDRGACRGPWGLRESNTTEWLTAYDYSLPLIFGCCWFS